MSFRDWEEDVEFFDVTPNGLVARLEDNYNEVQFSEFAVQDARVTYDTDTNKRVSVRVMGFTATNPMVTATVIYPGGRELFYRGALVGCQQPIERIILPGLLRSRYVPIIKPYGSKKAKFPLPIPAGRFSIQLPKD